MSFFLASLMKLRGVFTMKTAKSMSARQRSSMLADELRGLL
ncbi:hypothetical protein VIC_003188 [Vibrio coralliilyticus ATCC BAA-450]|nr:hypothetical protein VIC_003188 [Vibrio coralliilyticus ATCC BAA-450]